MVNAYDKYVEMKGMVDYLFEVFNANPNEHTSAEYGIALKEFQDFCVQLLDTLSSRSPEVLRCVEVTEYEGLCR